MIENNRGYHLKGAVDTPEVPELGARSPGVPLLVVWGRGVAYIADIFILNDIWAQGRVHILIGTLLGLNILLATLYRYWLQRISSTFCRRLKSAFFRCHNTPTNKMKCSCSRSSYFFVLLCRRKELLLTGLHIHLQGQYSILFLFQHCEKRMAETLLRVDRNRRSIKA
jgi:hypothetical protein